LPDDDQKPIDADALNEMCSAQAETATYDALSNQVPGLSKERDRYVELRNLARTRVLRRLFEFFPDFQAKHNELEQAPGSPWGHDRSEANVTEYRAKLQTLYGRTGLIETAIQKLCNPKLS
jgi:hypothetical protein